MKRWLKVLLIIVAAIILIAGIVFWIYVSDFDRATQPALSAMQSTELIEVDNNDDYIEYKPAGAIKCGIVFYPGGKVEPTVYSRVFSKLAENGILTVVVKMPFNLAMFNINGAEKVLANHTKVDEWYLSGHSLGGVFATQYLSKHIEDFNGMIYLASYPSVDISNVNIPVITINGTLDTVINRKGYEAARDKMPSGAIYYDIDGGNHTQFGDYNLQKKDMEASISAEEQHKQIVEQILKFLDIN